MALKLAEFFVALGASAKGFEETMGKVEAKLRRVGESFTRAGIGLTAGLTAPIAAIGAIALRSSIKFETAFASVRKNVDGTEEDLARLSEGIQDLASRIPATTAEIAAVASAAGQLGIETRSVLKFSETMIAMGRTTNLAADQAARGLAQIATITKLPQDQIDRLASTILKLGKTSNTTEAQITEMGTRIAGAASKVGLSEADFLALATAVASVGVQAEAGGTQISDLLIAISRAVSQGGQELETFAMVAGRSVEEFADLFRQDAVSAVADFVEGMGKLDQTQIFQVMEELGLDAARMTRVLTNLSGAGDLLRKSIVLARKEWEENVTLTETVNRAYGTTGSQLEILRNRLDITASKLGNALNPALKLAMTALNGVLEVLTVMVGAFSDLNGPIQLAVVGLAALAAGIGPVLLLMGTFTRAIAGASVALSFLAKHPIAILVSALAVVGLAIGTYVVGVNKAAAESRKLGDAATSTAEKLNNLEQALQGLGGRRIRLTAEITQLEAELSGLTEGVKRGFLSWSDYDKERARVEKGLSSLRQELQGLGQTQEKVAREILQARANEILDEATAAVDRAVASYKLLGDRQKVLSQQAAIWEAALEKLIPLLGTDNERVLQIAASIKLLRSELEKAGQTPPIDLLAGVGKKIGKELQSSQALAGVLAQVFKRPLEGVEAQIGLAEQAIKDYGQAALESGLSQQALFEDSRFQALIANLDALKAKYVELQFTHEAFSESFTKRWNEMASQLQVTGAEVAETIQGIFTSLADGIGNSVAQAIVYGRDFGDAIIDVLKQIAATIIQTLISLALQELIFLIIGIGVAAKRTAAELASAAAITYAAAFAGAAVGAIATGGIGLAAATGVAAAATAAMLAGAAGAGAAGAGVGAGVVALAEGGIVRKPTFALLGEAGPERVEPLRPGFRNFKERGLLRIEIPVNLRGREIARAVAEDLPALLQRKLGNFFG